MKNYTPTEQTLIAEGRDALINLAMAGSAQRRYMYRTLVALFLQRLEKAKPGAECDTFFLGPVVFAAIHSLATGGMVEEAHWLLDELGTLEDVDGTRIAAQPDVCLRISELRKSLAGYAAGPDLAA